MKRFIKLSTATFLISALLFGRYAVAQSSHLPRVTTETYKSLTLDFDLEGTASLLGGCSDQVSCKTHISERFNFNQVQSFDRQQFAVEVYGTTNIDPTESIVLYVLYFQKHVDKQGNLLGAIDVGVNPYNHSVQRKVKHLITRSLDTRPSGNDLIHSLGRLPLNLHLVDIDTSVSLPVFDVMVINHDKEEKNYSIRYIVDWEPKKIDYLAQADRINDYFANAVRVYAHTGEEASRVAILAAGKVAASVQRATMINFLKSFAKDFSAMGGVKEQATAKKLLVVAKELEEKDWTIDDIIQEKRRLKGLNNDYVNALNTADPSVFSRHYPSLFED